jgi:PAS domain S-box-containing protein
MMSSEEMRSSFDLYNYSPVPMWLYDINSLQILAVNDAACREYGYSREKFLSLKVDVLWHALYTSAMMDLINSAARQRLPYMGTVKFITRKGDMVIVDLQATPMTAWHADARIVSAINVTERERAKETERQLRLSNERFNYVSRASNEAIYDWDLAADNIYWADGFCRVFGYPLDGKPYPLKSWSRMVHPDDLLKTRESLRCALQDMHTIYWHSQYRFRHSIGTYLFVEETGYIIRNKEGRAIRMIGTLRDITSQRENAAALEASEKRYSDLFHLSPLPMWVYDMETYQFLDVNKAAVTFYGYSREEFLSMTLRDIRKPENRHEVDEIVRGRIKPREYHSAIVQHVKKSGEEVVVNVSGNSIAYCDKEARVVVAFDITEKRKYISAIEEHNARLEEITWTQAHLVRAPLARIMGITQLLSDAGVDVATKETLLSYLQVSATELDDIIRKIISKSQEVTEKHDYLSSGLDGCQK